METIPKSDCTHIGYFQKPHGVRGELVLITEEKYLDSLEDANWIFVELEGLLVPFRVNEDGIRIRSNNSALVHLDWVPDQDYAKRLSGKKVFLNNKDIIPAEGSFEPDDLTGYHLYGVKEGLIGDITAIDDFAGNIVLTVTREKREFLIPFNHELLVKFTPATKKIVMDIPEGLLE